MTKKPALFLSAPALALLALLTACDQSPSPATSGTGTAPTPTASAPAPAPANLPKTAGTFETAKKWLYEKVYFDHRISFYCGCDYSEQREVDLASCGMQALSGIKRAQKIEAEHLFPAAQFGNFRQCWREPAAFPECIKSTGKTESGRDCCLKVDPLFKAAHNDLYNLVPAVGEINGRRLDYNWGMISGEKREFGQCNIEIDPDTRRAEPPENVMGDIARAHFYMADTYGFRLSKQDQQLYTAWSKQDPPDAWEIERNRRIKAIQGQGNPYIER